jgi:hypothetical protein
LHSTTPSLQNVKIVLQTLGSRGKSVFGFSMSNNLDWQKNSKTKVEKVFSYIFIASCPEMSLFGTKNEKNFTEEGKEKFV